MPDLDQLDAQFLRQLPKRVAIHRYLHDANPSGTQIARLQKAGLVRGEVDVEASSRELLFMQVGLTDAGRAAIGLTVHGGDDAGKPA